MLPAAVNLHLVQASDAAALLRLRLEALQDTPEAFGEDYAAVAAQPYTVWVDQINHSLGDGDRAIFVATTSSIGATSGRPTDDRVTPLIGMAGVNRSPLRNMRHSASIWGVYVQPAWRDQGITTALVQACCDWGRAQPGLVTLRLAVITVNPAAIRCYEKCGFRASGADPKAFFVNGRFYDLLRMTLILAD